jgi:hypothetical protein
MRFQNLVSRTLQVVAVILVGLPLFWLSGGVRWLDTKVFPPQRPKTMPKNSVWIDAPELPISWHHGWWFGCDISSSGTTNQCRLVGADGGEANAGEYLPCDGRAPIPESIMSLVPPPRSLAMWIADARLSKLSPIGYLSNGDILLPAATLDRCGEFKQTRR